MGRLIYHRVNAFEIDDRLLAHVEAVISAKLRRQEPFLMTLATDAAQGGGRSTLWVNGASDLVCRYRHDRVGLNRAWFEALMATANSPAGLTLVDEPDAA